MYLTYLRSAAWREMRRRVFARDPLCQRCGLRPSNVAHHLTYERLGHEALADVQGLCEGCHNVLHGGSPPPWYTDPEWLERHGRQRKPKKPAKRPRETAEEKNERLLWASALAAKARRDRERRIADFWK